MGVGAWAIQYFAKKNLANFSRSFMNCSLVLCMLTNITVRSTLMTCSCTSCTRQLGILICVYCVNLYMTVHELFMSAADEPFREQLTKSM